MYQSRDTLIAELRNEPSILEIGPFNHPCVRGPNVRYLDVMDTEALKERAIRLKRNPSKVPDIDFIGDLTVVDDSFNAVISAHCIEHQPDLIEHLRQVESVLYPGGRYYLIIPDKRYCFDYFLPESTVAEIIEAKGRKIHPLTKVIEHVAFTTHNDAKRHWMGDHQNPEYHAGMLPKVHKAVRMYERAAGSYLDVHSWQFTPQSYHKLMDELARRGETRLRLSHLGETQRDAQEFTAILSMD